MTEIIILVEDEPEGGFVANALGASIVTQAETLPELRARVRDAVECHFAESERPRTVRLHFVRDFLSSRGPI